MPNNVIFYVKSSSFSDMAWESEYWPIIKLSQQLQETVYIIKITMAMTLLFYHKSTVWHAYVQSIIPTLFQRGLQIQ